MESAIYYNPSYINSEECFAVYIKDNDLYKLDCRGNFRIFPSFNGELNENTLESFMQSRNFSKVLEMNNSTIDWFNDFEQQKQKVLNRVKSLLSSISNMMKYSSFNYSIMVKPYTIIAKLNKLLK